MRRRCTVVGVATSSAIDASSRFARASDSFNSESSSLPADEGGVSTNAVSSRFNVPSDDAICLRCSRTVVESLSKELITAGSRTAFEISIIADGCKNCGGSKESSRELLIRARARVPYVTVKRAQHSRSRKVTTNKLAR